MILNPNLHFIFMNALNYVHVINKNVDCLFLISVKIQLCNLKDLPLKDILKVMGI